MNNFQQATRIKLRFDTVKGSIGVEQLWDLKIVELASAIKASNRILKEKSEESDNLDFLSGTKSKAEEIEQLRFDIMKEIYTIKKAEQDKAKEAANEKERKEQIAAIIAKKQNESLESLSIDDLKKML